MLIWIDFWAPENKFLLKSKYLDWSLGTSAAPLINSKRQRKGNQSVGLPQRVILDMIELRKPRGEHICNRGGNG